MKITRIQFCWEEMAITMTKKRVIGEEGMVCTAFYSENDSPKKQKPKME
jgi:hypothetical protein